MPSSDGKQMDWLYTLSGFAVGAIVGLTGVGGGSLMTPLLVLMFGVAPVTAVGTDLLFAALTKTGGAWALAVALILTAGALLYREKLHAWAARRAIAQAKDASTARRTMTVGAILGVLVTVSSVGAGALGVTALFFLYPGLAAARIVGADIAHAVPLTLVAGLGHAIAGAVDWQLLVALLIGSLPGIWLGSALSQKIPERLLRTALAAMLVLIGGKLAF